MGGCKCVRAGGVPHKEPTTLPGYQSDSIGPFAIRADETSWLQPGWQMGRRHCVVDNLIDRSMTLVTTLAPFAAEAVGGSAVDLCTTMVTGVGAAKGRS